MISTNFDSDFKKIGESKIYFGHQSVGGNIINGISSLLPKFPVVEMNDDMEISGSYLLHSPIGKNEDPESKCVDFLQKIELLTGKIDIAMFKFCYIDINRKTDVESLFSTYQSTIEKVNNQYPDIKILHVTVPLTHCESGIGIVIRELLGRENKCKLDNIKRNQYNQLLRKSYPQSHIFDLANAESTYPDKSRNYFKWEGVEYENLIEAYSSDGRHLNQRGSEWVAAEMIRCIASSIDQ